MHFYTADSVFNGFCFLSPGSILAVNDNGVLEDVLPPGTVDPAGIRHFDGILTPGFVNAHCHLELSHLKGHIPEKTGLPAFGKQVIIQRNNFSAEQKILAQKQADSDMWNNGIVAVGDICNTAETFETKAQSPVFYHSFIELIGLHPSRINPVMDAGLELFSALEPAGLSGSLAPHAPYSTSFELIATIANFNMDKNLVSTIHNQESDDETRFFNGQENGFNDLYKFLQLDISWFKAPHSTSLAYYANALQNQSTLLVHNTFTSKADRLLTHNKPVYWCFCPNANLYIENRLPDFDLFNDTPNTLCVGTDSLASNHQLDLISEINHILRNSSFTIEPALAMLTSNGAKALKLSHKFGSLIKGINTGLNLIKNNNGQLEFLKKLH